MAPGTAHFDPARNADCPARVIDVTFNVGLGIGPAIIAALLFGLLALPAVGIALMIAQAAGTLRFAVLAGCIGGLSGAAIGRVLVWGASYRFRKLLIYIPPPINDGSGDDVARQASILEVLQQVAQSFGVNGIAFGGKGNALCRCALELVRAGAGGKAIRLATIPLPPPGPPLDVPFEPVPLRDARQGFIDLRGRRVSMRERLSGYLFQLKQLHAGRLWMYRAALVTLMVGLVVLLAQAGWTFLSLMQGRMRADFLVIAVVFLAAVALILGHTLRVDRWYLVPGGLIVMRPRWFSPWTVRLLRRNESVLLCLTHVNQVAVAHSDGFVDRRAVSPWELDLLLRAWRSPLPHPSDALVQSLLQP